jgi:hypothetical protein
MHRALELLEIVETICDQVYKQPIPSEMRKDLAILARTCTSFLNPALNVLWRDQQTICNLLRCMPDDLWDIAEYGTVYRFDYHIDIVRTKLFQSFFVDLIVNVVYYPSLYGGSSPLQTGSVHSFI